MIQRIIVAHVEENSHSTLPRPVLDCRIRILGDSEDDLVKCEMEGHHESVRIPESNLLYRSTVSIAITLYSTINVMVGAAEVRFLKFILVELDSPVSQHSRRPCDADAREYTRPDPRSAFASWARGGGLVCAEKLASLKAGIIHSR